MGLKSVGIYIKTPLGVASQNKEKNDSKTVANLQESGLKKEYKQPSHVKPHTERTQPLTSTRKVSPM